MAFGRNFPSTAMSEHERFSVPHEIDEILERLPPQVTLNVPDHILSLWFPPGPSTASWKEQRSRALKATRKAVHADSHITVASVKGSSISRYRRTTDPAKKAPGNLTCTHASQTSFVRMRALRRSIATTATTTMMI